MRCWWHGHCSNGTLTDLVDVLGLLDCDYEDDPSNQNSQFERVQMREFLRDAAASGSPLTDDALRLGRAMQALSDHLDTASSTLWQGQPACFRRVMP